MAKYRQLLNDRSRDIYITDCLKLIAENTAKAVKEGKYLNKRYADLFQTETEEEDQTELADEIVADFLQAVEKIGGAKN